VSAAAQSNRRQEILAEATALFAAHGYSGASIRQIAAACGITEAAIYRHFESKLHLYEEAIRDKAAAHDIAGHLETVRGRGTLQELLLAVSTHIINLTRLDPDLMRLMFNNSLESGDVAMVLFREIRLPYVEFVRQELVRRQAAGEVLPVDPRLTSRCFVGMVMDCALNLGVWQALQPSQVQPVDLCLNSSAIIARGLTMDRESAGQTADSPTGRNP
jgi:AcrR family transcriptional regulator